MRMVGYGVMEGITGPGGGRGRPVSWWFWSGNV